MARYFFHTNLPSERHLQNEGMEYPSVQKAKCEAVAYAGRLICDASETFWDTSDFEMIVTDENGLMLFTMRVVGTEAPAIRTGLRSV